MGKGDKKKPRRKPPRQMVPLVVKPVRRPGPSPRVDERAPALVARTRQLGINATQAALDAVSGQHSGSAVWQALALTLPPTDCQRAWAAFDAYCKAQTTWERLCLGMSPFAKGAAITMVPDAIEADESHTVDLRDIDEKIDDAARAKRRWDGHFAQMPAMQHSAIVKARLGNGLVIVTGGRVTGHGRALVRALMRLADVVG